MTTTRRKDWLGEDEAYHDALYISDGASDGELKEIAAIFQKSAFRIPVVEFEVHRDRFRPYSGNSPAKWRYKVRIKSALKIDVEAAKRDEWWDDIKWWAENMRCPWFILAEIKLEGGEPAQKHTVGIEIHFDAHNRTGRFMFRNHFSFC